MSSIVNTLRSKGITKFNTAKLLYRFTHFKTYVEGQDTIYLVYTLGKVGSQTIYITLRQELLETDVFHLHFLSDSCLNNPNTLLSKKFRSIQKAKKVRRIASTKKKIKIVSLVREPIAKTVSQLFQTPEGFGLTEDNLLKMKPENICNFLTTQAINKFYDPSKWFDSEFLDFTGIDIYRTPFDRLSRKQTNRLNKFDVLILRNEDLQSEKLILNHLQSFVGKSIDNFTVVNKSSDKKTGEVYKQVKSKISFSDNFLNEIYSSKYCQHFYSQTEIEELKKRWSYNN